MRLLAAIAGVCFLAAMPVAGQAADVSRVRAVVVDRQLPAGAQPLYAQLQPRLTPQGRAWAATQAKAFATGKRDEAQIRADAATQPGTLIAGGDIDALMMIVMMQSAQDAQSDLRGQMAQMQAERQKKQAMRDAHDQMKDKLDLMSEMGETESLRLQMAMDRVSRLMTTLSNIEKKQDDTASSITQNMK